MSASQRQGVSFLPESLRAALKSSPDVAHAVFAGIDADGSGEVSSAEISAALSSLLPPPLSPQTLENISETLALFDTDDSGRISKAEWEAWVREVTDDAGLDAVSVVLSRIRGVLLALGEEEMDEWFGGEGRGGELSVEDLGEILASLGLADLQQRDIRALFKRIDASNDGYITQKELQDFLQQKQFAHNVTTVLKNAARRLRARGAPLPLLLLAAAVEERPDAVSGLRDEDLAKVALSPDALRRVLIDQLGLPLTAEKVEAIVIMADVDGNKCCEIGEVCALADENCADLAVADLRSFNQSASLHDGGPVAFVGSSDLWASSEDATDDWWNQNAQGLVLSDPMIESKLPEGRDFKTGLPATAWRSIVDQVFGLVLAASGTAAATLDASRLPQLAAFLGLSVPNGIAVAFAARHQLAPNALDLNGFRRCVHDITSWLWQQGKLELRPLATGRLRHILTTRAPQIRANVLQADTGLDGVLYRWQAALALSEQCKHLGLKDDEVIELVSACPGLHRSACQLALRSRPSHAPDLTATMIMRSSAATQMSAFPVSTPIRGSGTPRSEGSLPSNTPFDSIASVCPTPDFQVSAFLSWLHRMAHAGACVELIHEAASTGETMDAAMLARNPEYMSLSGAARSAVRALCSPMLAIPTLSTSVRMGEAGKPIVQAEFLTNLMQLPLSFYPSKLAPLSYVHPAASLQGVLLDGGIEIDPANAQSVFAPATPPMSPMASIAPPTLPSPAYSQTSVGSHDSPSGQPLTSPSVSYSIASAAASQGHPALQADTLGLSLRYTSISPGSAPAQANCLPAGAAPLTVAPRLRSVGAAASTGDLAWAAEGMLVRPHHITALAEMNGGKGIPCPVHEGFRSSIVGRVVRVALVNLVMPSDPTGPQSIRILSNIVPLPASWSPLIEDEWSIGSGMPAALNRLVLRSDAPRDMGGPSSCLVLFELNVQMKKLDGAALKDGYRNEEITCAWGLVPLMQLSSHATTHRVRLSGGTPGCTVDIDPKDIIQRRTNWRAVAKAFSGGVSVPEISLTSRSLTKLTAAERQVLGELPLCAIVPSALVHTVTCLRRCVAKVLLAKSTSHMSGKDARFPSVPLAVARQLLGMHSSLGGAPSVWHALATALEKEWAASSKGKVGLKDEDVLERLLVRLLPAISVSAVGLGLPPGLDLEEAMADVAAKYLSTALSPSLSDAAVVFKPVNPLDMLL